MAKIVCPGCGAEIDTEKEVAEFKVVPVDPEVGAPPSDSAAAPAVATVRRGNAFFKPRKEN